MIYDTENRWALEDAAGPRNQGLFYKETVEKSYRAFRRLGLDVDVIDETQGLSDYQIVAAPVVYLQREGWVEKYGSLWPEAALSWQRTGPEL